MSLAEKIKSLESEIVAAKDQMVGLVKSAEADARDLTAVEAEEIDTLNGTIEAKEKSLGAYKQAEQNLAQDIASPAVVKSQHLGSVKSRKGEDMLFAKMATAAFAAHAQQKSVEQVVAENFAADRELNAVVKSAVGPALTTQAGWAAELVRQGYADFTDALKPTSFYAQLASAGTQVQFGGMNSISLPSQTANGGLAPAWITEGSLIPVKKTSYAAKVLNRYKLGVISHFSRELAEVSVPSIQGLITQQMLIDASSVLDGALISANPAVANKSPAGLLNGVTVGTSAGSTAADILTDIKTLVTPLIAGNASNNIVLLMNPLQELALSFATTATGSYVFRDQLAAGRLNGYRVIVSGNIPAGTVIAVAADSFASAFDMPEFRVSDSASLVQADDGATEPTVSPDKNNFGAVTGGSVVSLFQQELIAVRMIMPTSFIMRRDGMVSAINGVAW